ncbi:MAG: GntR family transcriptional regulator [Actinomycetota bacterium]|nr:GntR family transcriptional regulator [Actinomycetota bacterium]
MATAAGAAEGQTHKTGEAVAALLRQRIVRGELPVGTKLPTEEELTERFGIARTTLREALRILESQGLIRIKRGRGGGGTVTMPDLARLSEAFAGALQMRGTSFADLDSARRLIEPELAAWLAMSHDDDDLALLAAAADAAQDAADDNDLSAFAVAASRFHTLLLERGRNTTLSLFSQLLNQLVEHRYQTGAQRANQPLLRRAARSYAKLLTLIAAGDADAARTHWQQQMTYMIESAPDQLIDYYDGPSPRLPVRRGGAARKSASQV